jgi:hypothetical protein
MFDAMTGVGVFSALAGLSAVAGGLFYISLRVLLCGRGWDGSASFFSGVAAYCQPEGRPSPRSFRVMSLGLAVMVCGSLLSAYFIKLGSAVSPYDHTFLEASARDAFRFVVEFYF